MKTKIIRPKELAEMLSVSPATLWRMEKRGELPPKIKLSKRAVGWRKTDVEDWIESKMAENKESGSPGNITDE